MVISGLPFELKHERTIEQLEGPFIVLYRNDAGEPFLDIWLDRLHVDEGAIDRWMLIRVAEMELIRYEFLKRTLRQTVLDARDGLGYVRDVRGGEVIRTAVLPLAAYPVEYLPSEDSLHDQLLNPRFSVARNEQKFLLDGEWEMHGFNELERKYRQAYAFMGAFGDAPVADKELLRRKLKDASFESGWNYKAAFDMLDISLPYERRAKLVAVQYQSPGYLQFRVEGLVADSLRKALVPFYENDKELWKRYGAAHRIVIAMGRMIADQGRDGAVQEPGFKRLEQDLRLRLVELSNVLASVDSDELLTTVESTYVAGELLLTFVRRMQTLVEYSAKGLAELAGIPLRRVHEDEEL